MGTLLSLRIQERFEELTPSEQKLATVLLERSDDILTFSATELAQLSGVSKATAARLFRSLGYSDFNEVRLQARQERNRTGPTQSVMVPFEHPSGAASISTHLLAETHALTRTFESLRSDLLATAVEMLAGERRVWISGFGAHAGAARYAATLFARIRPGVHMLSEDMELWPEELASLGPGDLLFLIVARPWPPVTASLLDFAQTARVRSIVLTDPTSNTKVKRYGGLALLCYSAGQGAAAGVTAFTSMIGLLHLATSSRLGTSAVVRSDLISSLRDQLRND